MPHAACRMPHGVAEKQALRGSGVRRSLYKILIVMMTRKSF
jgi:hypothetical protein